MRTVDTLKAEHDGVLTVLAQLDRAAAAAERGAAVPVDIFADIQEFFSIFVDRCHHGKEEQTVFEPLAQQRDGSSLVRQLESEHATGRHLAGAYASAVREYTPDDVEAASRLAEAARAYAAFLRDHIDVENTRLFPLIERELAAQDDFLVAAFDRIEIEQIGAGTHERLHGTIDSLGPRIDPWVS